MAGTTDSPAGCLNRLNLGFRVKRDNTHGGRQPIKKPYNYGMKIVPEKWVCPRCKSQDVYWAKRQVGQMGGLIDNPTDFSPAFTRGIEQNVALCRDCGERMNLIHKEIKIAETEAEKQREKTKNKAFNWFMLLMIIIVIAEIWSIYFN